MRTPLEKTFRGAAILSAALVASVAAASFTSGAAAQTDWKNEVLRSALALPAGELDNSPWTQVDSPDGPRLQSGVDGVGLVQVDPETGRLNEVIFEHALTSGPSPDVTVDTAQIAAEGALADLLPGRTDGAVARPAELIDHGTWREIRLTWQARSGDAWLPDVVNVGVNAATAEVAYVWSQQSPTTVGTVPTIDASTALANAQALLPPGQATTADQPELVVAEGAGGQRLVWQVALRPAHGAGPRITSSFLVHVDALSGDAAVHATA